MTLRALLVGICLWLPHSAAAQVNTEAVRMVEMFFDRCVEPLMAGQPLITDGLDALDEKTALSKNKQSDGRAWMPPDAYVSLNSLKNNMGQVGCVVQFESDLNGDRKIAERFVIDQFNAWVAKRVEAGAYTDLKTCGTRDGHYQRVVESSGSEPVTVRLVLDWTKTLNFIILIAAEIKQGEPAPSGC